MPVVGMPDGTQVSFPDEMPADQIKGLIAQKFPEQVKHAAPDWKSKIPRAFADIPSEISNAAGENWQAIKEGFAPEGGKAAQGAIGGLAATGKGLLGITGLIASPITGAARSIGGHVLADTEHAIGTLINPTIAAKDNPQEMYQTAKGGVDQAMSAMAPGRKGAAVAPPAPKVGDLGVAADKGYEAFRATGGSYSPEITTALADSVQAALREKGAYPHLAEPVHKTVDILRKEGPTSVDEVRSVLEGLSGLRVDPDGKVRRAANIATTEIKQFLARTEPEAAGILEEANANKSAQKRAEKIDQAEEIAGLRAGRAGYGGNAVNTMRQVLSPIVEKAIKGNKQGFNPEEIRAMNDIVVGNTATNALRGIGQLSPSKGAIQTGIAIGSGGVSAVVGAAANKLATILTSKQIDRLNELVRKRSPAYQEAVGKSADKYFTAADMFIESPSQANLLKTIISARALSSGLTRDGIDAPSGLLLRYLQSPSQSGAEED